MKELVIALALVAVSTGAFARGWHHGGCHHRGGWHRGYYHHHHGGYWGPGGRYFWPGFVGGVVGGALYNAVTRPYYVDTVVVEPAATVVTTPTVVQHPVVIQQPTVVQQPSPVVTVQRQPVWVEGRYVDQVQANGSTVRVWQPGHYE